MKKVLIICDSFPPHAHISGLRAAMMAKYLPRFGWDPYVISQIITTGELAGKMDVDGLPPESKMLAIYAGGQFFRRHRYSWLKRIFNLPFIEKSHPPGFYQEVVSKLDRWLEDKHFDAIWATGPGAAPFAIARKISEKQNCPWIADYRDHHLQGKYLNTPMSYKINCFRRGYAMTRHARYAAASTTISKYHRGLVTQDGIQNCHVIYNGFDHELFAGEDSTLKRGDTFSIFYTGVIRDDYRNPKLLFEAMDQLLADGTFSKKKVSIDFYGCNNDLSKFQEFNSYQLCNFHKRVPFNQIPGILSNAGALLVLTEMKARGVLTTKFFEYLAADKPIIIIPTEENSEIAQILQKANAGFAGSSLTRLKEFIRDQYLAWENGSIFHNNRDIVKSYSREQQARALASLLESCLAGKK